MNLCTFVTRVNINYAPRPRTSLGKRSKTCTFEALRIGSRSTTERSAEWQTAPRNWTAMWKCWNDKSMNTKRNLFILSLVAGTMLPAVALAQDVPPATSPEAEKSQEAPKASYALTANVFLVSDYFFRGITQTWGEPAIRGGADFVHDSGFYVGTWASNVSGNQFAGGSIEWDFYGGYNYKINDDFSAGAGLYYY